MSIDAESLDHEQKVEQLLQAILLELVRLNAYQVIITNEVIKDQDLEIKE